MAVGNKFYLSNKKDGAAVFHRGDIITSFNYYPPIFYARLKAFVISYIINFLSGLF